MPPKPFPSQLHIGIDICKITRIRQIIQGYDASRLQKWGSKVFNGKEWPHFMAQLQRWNRNSTDEVSHRKFAQWVAGRWAAKEAAIKAHTSRRLSRLQVSIVSERTDAIHAPYDVDKPMKPTILIDPRERLVTMDRAIAMKRGLRGFVPEPNTEWSTITRTHLQELVEWNKLKGCRSTGDQILNVRRLLVKEEDRQLADLSISHDGEYAVAVCMAVDEEYKVDTKELTDNGEGDPIHEPEWGDRGFGGGYMNI